MKILISPAKSLDFESNLPTKIITKPYFVNEANNINSILKKKSPQDIQKLMTISEKLADLNWERNQNFSAQETDKQKNRAAIYAFNGDVYSGLDPYTLPEEKIDKMQIQIRILSGLYGILRPLDQIQAYRLEMGTKISIGSNNNLYSFWKNKVTNQLKSELEDRELILNLASKEYFSVIDTSLLSNTIISPEFKDFKNGKLKIISFYAKKARGLMARYLIDEDVSDLEGIRLFSSEGYRYSEEESKNETSPVFIR
ncbi:MAG: peroxide stress protein YaaA [Flavobacteriaceae bacterium]